MQITDSHGNPVFELSKAGPLLFVSLPKGKYRVTARFKSVAGSQEVDVVATGGKDLYFRWNGAS